MVNGCGFLFEILTQTFPLFLKNLIVDVLKKMNYIKIDWPSVYSSLPRKRVQPISLLWKTSLLLCRSYTKSELTTKE
jgi:hypothetical protein